MSQSLRYTVSTLRAAGLEARWGRNRAGAPLLFARDPDERRPSLREAWFPVTDGLWQSMQRKGVVEAFRDWTLLADVFSVPF